MKSLKVTGKTLRSAGRWDIDYHLPAEGIQRYPAEVLQRVDSAADVIKTKRDPTKKPDESFAYIDIASVDVLTGEISNPQELTGAEAPSRARKVVHAYDIIISTCRPTRGAIAVIPEELHGQICSTGFSVIRAKPEVNPYFLHFVLRLDSTLEQFRKWSTGSSYPAILDEDVAKTKIPLPCADAQDEVAKQVRTAQRARAMAIEAANNTFQASIASAIKAIESNDAGFKGDAHCDGEVLYSLQQITERLASLVPVEEEPDENMESYLFDEVEEDEPVAET